MRTRIRLPLILISWLCACAVPAAGQRPLAVGLRLGLTVSAMQFQDPSTAGQTEGLVGFQGGIVLQRDLHRFATAEVDLLYSREGFRGEGAHTGGLLMDYLAIPVLLHLRTPGRVSFDVAMGGSARLGIRCRQSGVARVGTIGCDDPVMGAEWKRLDVAANFGAGVSLPVAGRTVTTGALVSWGLRDLDGGLFVPGSVHSLTVNLSVAVLAPMRRNGAGGGQ